MFSDLVGLVISIAPVIGLLVWQTHTDRRQRAAAIVRADIYANVTRALEGESLIGEASRAVLERVPFGYHVIIDCGGGS